MSTAQQPFDPQAVKTPSGGCGKAALLGCGVILLLIGIGAVVFVLKAKDFFGWTMTKMQTQILSEIDRAAPPGMTAEDRARLEAAFPAAIAKVTSGDPDPASLSKLQSELQAALGRGGTWTREDVLSLVGALEAIAGIAPPAGPSEAAPTPDAAPGDAVEPVPGAEPPAPGADAPAAAGTPA